MINDQWSSTRQIGADKSGRTAIHLCEMEKVIDVCKFIFQLVLDQLEIEPIVDCHSYIAIDENDSFLLFRAMGGQCRTMGTLHFLWFFYSFPIKCVLFSLFLLEIEISFRLFTYFGDRLNSPVA